MNAFLPTGRKPFKHAPVLMDEAEYTFTRNGHDFKYFKKLKGQQKFTKIFDSRWAGLTDFCSEWIVSPCHRYLGLLFSHPTDEQGRLRVFSLVDAPLKIEEILVV